MVKQLRIMSRRCDSIGLGIALNRVAGYLYTGEERGNA
jgi:hypothetical protein